MTTTATEQISAVSVINMLGEIVEGHEDYVYDNEFGCVYFDSDGAPSCLVGHVLAAYGYTAQLFMDWYTSDGTYGNQARFDWVRNHLDLPFTDAAANLLTYAQVVQDERIAWGVAHARALALYEDMRESETP